MLERVSSHRSTQAEGTAAILQQAAANHRPVLIPGALERRAGRPSARPAIGAAESVAPGAGSAAADNRARLEREREGGGAPGERSGKPRWTIFARLWRGSSD